MTVTEVVYVKATTLAMKRNAPKIRATNAITLRSMRLVSGLTV